MKNQAENANDYGGSSIVNDKNYGTAVAALSSRPNLINDDSAYFSHTTVQN